MTEIPATRIDLSEPVVNGQTVKFDWIVSPESEIYKETGFYLTFPDDIPVADVPMRLWWTVFIMCIHSNWALLRPCVVYLPVKLGPGEAGVWTRLVLSYADTLDALNKKLELPRDIRIVEQGECLESITPLNNQELCAAAFSGGKDSLAQAGLLMEMGYKPILVSTTSPMPGEKLHVSSFRESAMDEMQNRYGLQLLEVQSDLRSNWNNRVPRQWGFKLSMNEVTDTLLYTAALAVCGYVHGATRLYLASETEVSQSYVENGVFLQYSHFMYSALTQAGISTLLKPFGMQFGSLNSSLYSDQVQKLLVRRYPHMSDLQCSCWKSDDSSKACSECSECKRLAWVVLAGGGSPANLGVNLIKMIQAWVEYVPQRKKPRKEQGKQKSSPHQPNLQVGRGFKRQIAHAILSLSPEAVESYISRNHPEALLDGSAGKTLRNLLAIQEDIREGFPDPPDESRYRAAYLGLLDNDIGNKLQPILDDQFLVEDSSLYADQFKNLMAAIDWVTDPIRRVMNEENSIDAPQYIEQETEEFTSLNSHNDSRISKVCDYRHRRNPALSIVVVGYQSPEVLQACLDSLRRQTWTDFEVIIVDNGGSLVDARWQDGLSIVGVHMERNYLQVIARNVGASFARAEVLLLLDEDAILAPDTVGEIHRFFSATDVIISRCRMYYKTESLFNKVATHFDLGDEPLCGYLHESGMAIRTKVYSRYGGYDEKLLPGGEYMYWLYHIGKNYGLDKVIYFPKAVLWTDYSTSLKHIMRKNWIHAKGIETVRVHFPEFIEYRDHISAQRPFRSKTLSTAARTLNSLRKFVHRCGKWYYRALMPKNVTVK